MAGAAPFPPLRRLRLWQLVLIHRSQRGYERFGGLHVGTADAARMECFWLYRQPVRSCAWNDRTKISLWVPEVFPVLPMSF